MCLFRGFPALGFANAADKGFVFYSKSLAFSGTIALVVTCFNCSVLQITCLSIFIGSYKLISPWNVFSTICLDRACAVPEEDSLVQGSGLTDAIIELFSDKLTNLEILS